MARTVRDALAPWKAYTSLMSRSPLTDTGLKAPPGVPRLPNLDASMWSAALDSSGATPTVSTTSAVPSRPNLMGGFMPILLLDPWVLGTTAEGGRSVAETVDGVATPRATVLPGMREQGRAG